MFPQADLIYRCDGSLEGLLCCVFESFTRKQEPMDIWEDSGPLLSLSPEQTIPTLDSQSQRVWRGVVRRSPQAADWLEKAFLSGEPDKLMLLYRFCLAVFQRGSSVTSLLGDSVVSRTFQLVRGVQNEAHLLTGFLRFEEHGGVLAAEISPKAFVLPLLGPHFAGRYPGEAFLIHDLSHGAVLLHQGTRMEIFPLEGLELAPLTPQEQQFQRLWRQYYDTIAIRERLNPSCRMTHCPKRYWQHMLEMNPQPLSPLSKGSSPLTTLAPPL